MSKLLILDVATDSAAGRATLRLRDEGGHVIAEHDVALADHRPALWAGLFDMRRHVRRMASVEAPEAQLAALGRFLGERVLGPDIARRLADGEHQRTVLVRLPDPGGDDLAAAFARVPWELATAPGDERRLLDRNVVVRAAPAGATPRPERSIPLAPGEPVRVLLVFAEGPGSNPLAMRLERERLRDLFFEEVMPERNVEVDVLCHGVTRRRLREQVRERGGYHVVHWSGHGHVDALEIGLDEGEEAEPWIAGKELVGLFSGSEGFVPPVVFLSACHSGSLGNVKDWPSFQAALRDPEGDTREGAPALGEMLRERVGFTGAALALIEAGVKQVVAMRYEVGDRYARRLARRFYRRLLADRAHHPVDAALAMARRELARDERGERGEYAATDHVTPVVFGGELVRIEPPARRSAQMDRQNPRPQPLLPEPSKELDPPHGFVGRGRELTELSRRWLATGGAPIALIQGLAGLGKTALAAEAVHLWFDRFDYVFCFQAKGRALSIEEFYRGLDLRLVRASKPYRERCQEDDMARVYLAPGPLLKGAEREEVLRNNLIDVLTRERVLLVLDNFEKSLVEHAGADGYGSQDPAWDRLFVALGNRLNKTGSRLLVTSRHKLAALAAHAVWLPLGPLPLGEARLFFEGQRSIRGLLYGDDEAQRLARRILDVSRGHPLILSRIADLARAYGDKSCDLTSAGRAVLGEALDRLQRQGFKTLPEVFVGAKTEKGRDEERAYLEDVTIGAVDLLIGRLSGDARWLLWIVTRADEPMIKHVIASIWGESSSRLLRELCDSGLLVREEDVFTFHELVAERAASWMDLHREERGGWMEAEVWTSYGIWYSAAFKALVAASKRDLASEAGRRGIRYLVRARAFERLEGFAGQMVTGTIEPTVLEQLIADLQTAAVEVPAGQTRWRLRRLLADALRNAGRPAQALSLYAQAAEEAEAAEHWLDLGLINDNSANALRDVGQFERARETYLKGADAKRREGAARIEIVSRELAALRVDVRQGRAEDVLPTIELKLGEVRAWWALRQQGESVPEAPDDEMLARTLLIGFDIAGQAHYMLGRWQPCLDLLEESEQVQRALGVGEHALARTRVNCCTPMIRLGKLVEAKALLEGCLDIFHRVEDVAAEATTLSALAIVWDDLGDPAQAIALERRALAVRERLPDPGDRAISHNNLAINLYKLGSIGEAKAHQIASLVYTLVTGLDTDDSLHGLALQIYKSAARGETFTFPPLADLLATPAFAPLRSFLAERAIPTDELQATIDNIVEQVCTAVATAPGNPPPAT